MVCAISIEHPFHHAIPNTKPVSEKSNTFVAMIVKTKWKSELKNSNPKR